MESFHVTPSSKLELEDRRDESSYLVAGPTGQVHSGCVLELVQPGFVLDSTSSTSRFKATGRFAVSAIAAPLQKAKNGECHEERSRAREQVLSRSDRREVAVEPSLEGSLREPKYQERADLSTQFAGFFASMLTPEAMRVGLSNLKAVGVRE
jgi:hypothetical protein